MSRRSTRRYWEPVLLLRDALGRFASLRRPTPIKVRRPRIRKPTLPIFTQLELPIHG